MLTINTTYHRQYRCVKDYSDPKQREIVPQQSGWYIIRRMQNGLIEFAYYEADSDFWWQSEYAIEDEKNKVF